MNESANRLAELKRTLKDFATTDKGQREAVARDLGTYLLPVIAEIESLEQRLQTLERKPPGVAIVQQPHGNVDRRCQPDAGSANPPCRA